MLNQGVHLILRVLIFVSATAHPNSDPGRQILDSFGPNELIEVRIDADILGEHDFFHEGLYSSESGRGPFLKCLLESELRQVDSSISGDWLKTLLGGLSALTRSDHWMDFETAKI